MKEKNVFHFIPKFLPYIGKINFFFFLTTKQLNNNNKRT